jgi:rhamnose utilization protein RhaD (predicted bifunctional aldolase and dehydrogenase)
MHIKGSGWDLSSIEPAGLPALKLEPLKKLFNLKTLRDEDMVRIQREQLIDKNSPNPSIETLLHAFLPHKYIDHTHSNAILSLTDQIDGYKIIKDLFGDKVLNSQNLA